MADKKDLTLKELTDSLQKNNIKMSESMKAQLEAIEEANKTLKEDSTVQKAQASDSAVASRDQKKVVDSQAEMVNILKDIKNILKTVASKLDVVPKNVEKTAKPAVAGDEPTIMTDGVAVSADGSAELLVVAKNTGALLGIARDINVIRQNIINIGKQLGAKTTNKSDMHRTKESSLAEKARVDIEKAGKTRILTTGGIGGGSKPPGGGATPPMGDDKSGGILGKLKGVGNSMSGWAKNLLALSAALFITAKAFQQFAEVTWSGVIKGTVAMFALAKAAKMAGSGDSYKSILALGAGTLGLAYAMDKFADVTWSGIFKGALAMFALAKAAKVAGSGDSYKSILALGVGTLALAYGLDKFADVPWGGVITGTIALFALAKAAKIAGSGDAYKSILAIGVGVLAAAYGLDKFSEVSWGGVIKGTVAMIALAKAAKVAGSGDAHKTILALGVGTLALAFAMGMFADVPWAGVIKGSIALLGLGVAAKMIGNDGWKTILALGGAMFILSKAFQNFAEISWGDFAKGLVAMAALVVVTDLASGSLVGGGAMLLLAGAVYIISEAFKNFAEISWGDVLKGVAVIAVLALGAAALAALALPIVITAGALTLLGISLIALGAGISAISEGLTNITSSIKEIAELDGENLLKVAAGIGAIALALLAFGAAQMATALSNLVTNFLSLGQDSPVEQLEKIGKAGPGIEKAAIGMERLAAAMKSFADVDPDVLDDLMDALNDFPWLRATLYAKAGGVFNVTTAKASITGGDGSKMKGAAPAAAPGKEASPADKAVPVSKAPMTSTPEKLVIGGKEVTPGTPLTADQKSAIKSGKAAGNVYPDWVEKKYKDEGDQVAAKSSETAAAQRAPAKEGGDRTLINAPTTVNKSTQNTITKLPVRNSDPSYVDYIRRKFVI